MEKDISKEEFKGYCISEKGIYGPPKTLVGQDQVMQFVAEKVTKHFMVKIMNSQNQCVLDVKDQRLLYPIPEDGSSNNKWDKFRKRFVTMDITPANQVANRRKNVIGDSLKMIQNPSAVVAS